MSEPGVCAAGARARVTGPAAPAPPAPAGPVDTPAVETTRTTTPPAVTDVPVGTGDRPGATSPRRRPALSPSRAADFRTCPLLYRFRAIDRLPERPGLPQVRGTLVHAVLERLYALPAAERTPGTAAAMVGPAWVDLVVATPGLADVLFGPDATPDDASLPGPTPEQAAAEPAAGPPGGGFACWFASAQELVADYFALEDPRAVEVDSVELLVETELGGGLPLRGFVDRVDTLPGGALRVVDYKTGRVPRESGEAAAMFQLKFYALALLQLRGTVPDELRLLYLQGGQWLSYSPDADELLRFARVLDALWEAIRVAGRDGDFPPRRSGMCRFCSYRARCPEWGGTPPPYPGWPRSDEDPAPDAG